MELRKKGLGDSLASPFLGVWPPSGPPGLLSPSSPRVEKALRKEKRAVFPWNRLDFLGRFMWLFLISRWGNTLAEWNGYPERANVWLAYCGPKVRTHSGPFTRLRLCLSRPLDGQGRGGLLHSAKVFQDGYLAPNMGGFTLHTLHNFTIPEKKIRLTRMPQKMRISSAPRRNTLLIFAKRRDTQSP